MLTNDFRNALHQRFSREAALGRASLEINAGALHSELGGYPGPSHRMPALCQAMWGEFTVFDEVVACPPKKKGASLTIRYVLPRRT
jgi:5-methylcytosine-specific restriction protein A